MSSNNNTLYTCSTRHLIPCLSFFTYNTIFKRTLARIIGIGRKYAPFFDKTRRKLGSRFLRRCQSDEPPASLFGAHLKSTRRRRLGLCVFCLSSFRLKYRQRVRTVYYARATTAHRMMYVPVLPPAAATPADVRREQVTRGGVSICPIIAPGI